ncbi:MAG: response regulator [Spirochaetaceae bacterium]|nr:response regulator [Spirochaetaceae bacterium]
MLKLLIKSKKMDVINANNGLEAIECVKNGHFNIILMDIKMPIMDGIEAT